MAVFYNRVFWDHSEKMGDKHLTFGKKDEGRRRTGNPQAPLLGRERVSRKDARIKKKERESEKRRICLLSSRSLSLSSFALRRAEKEKGKERCIDLRAQRGFFHASLSLSKTWNTNTSGAGKRRLKFSD